MRRDIPPRVGIDYDEPIFPWYDYAHDASVLAGLTTIDQEPPTRWDPHSHYGCTIEEWFAVLDAEVDKGVHGMYARPAKQEAIEAIRRLYRRGYEVHIITARGQFGTRGPAIKRLTKRQLIVEGIPHNSLTFTQNKFEAIRDLRLDFFLDDRPDYYAQAMEAGADSYLLDERWNQDFEVPEDRRLFSTKEYVDRVLDVAQYETALSDTQRRAIIYGNG